MSRSLRRWSIALLVLLCLLLGGAVILDHDLRWRTQVLLEKATGKLPEVAWGDLLFMLRPRSGVYLEPLVDTPNPYEVIESPRLTSSQLAAARQLFNQNCSVCHGEDARGGAGGPALRNHVFRQGGRPWALYRTITFGVPGTAMVGRGLPRADVWTLVAYLDRILSARGAASAAKASVHVDPVTADELDAASGDPAEWLTYSGSYSGQRHSSLKQIDRDSVARLHVAWERQFADAPDGIETSPIVRGGTMFVTVPPNRVQALDASSGRVLWTFSRELPQRLQLCCGPANRGVAVFGDRVFVGTLDAHLLALDAATGRLVWDVAVADSRLGYSITGAPLALRGLVVTGVGGGEYGVRGFIDAYDAASGRRRWRFYTAPAPGEPGSETWKAGSLAKPGASTWLTGSYDPQLGLIYWGVGNPSPNYFGDDRQGDNLYCNSVVALDSESGRLRWYFQFTPHDVHDWDAAQIPVLAEVRIGGQPRRILTWANRNGFYYVLDRTNGQFVTGVAFAKQTWADGLDSRGRPRTRADSEPTRRGSKVYPSVYGATNWWSPSYDAGRQLLYVNTIARGSIYYAAPDRLVHQDGLRVGSWGVGVPGEDLTIAVKALDAATGQIRWTFTLPPRPADAPTGGLLSTEGAVVFGGDQDQFFALDSDSGRELWHFQAGGRIVASPITYENGGRQYVAIAAGHDLLAFALDPPAAGR